MRNLMIAMTLVFVAGAAVPEAEAGWFKRRRRSNCSYSSSYSKTVDPSQKATQKADPKQKALVATKRTYYCGPNCSTRRRR